jgi:putative methyltransferase (TIGR04325 family)
MNLISLLGKRRHPLNIFPAKSGPEVFSGDFFTWAEASAQCAGYTSDVIFKKTKKAAIAVKNGEAAFERDSVLFREEKYSWELLACLNLVAAGAGGRLSVLDFGGSLGSSYFQHRKMLGHLPDFSWTIVEQPHYVEFGAAHLQDAKLKFCLTLEDAMRTSQPNVALFGSVLEYLPDPFQVLQDVFSVGIDSLIVDRTAFLSGGRDRLTVQKVSPEIYDASYPAWFFSLEKFRNFMRTAGFELVTEWVCEDEFLLAGETTSFRGFYFEKNSGKK